MDVLQTVDEYPDLMQFTDEAQHFLLVAMQSRISECASYLIDSNMTEGGKRYWQEQESIANKLYNAISCRNVYVTKQTVR